MSKYFWSAFQSVQFSASYNATLQTYHFTTFFLKSQPNLLVKTAVLFIYCFCCGSPGFNFTYTSCIICYHATQNNCNIPQNLLVLLIPTRIYFPRHFLSPAKRSHLKRLHPPKFLLYLFLRVLLLTCPPLSLYLTPINRKIYIKKIFPSGLFSSYKVQVFHCVFLCKTCRCTLPSETQTSHPH